MITIPHFRTILSVAASVVTLTSTQFNAFAADAAQITVQAGNPGKPVASTMFGLFFEDINYAADGGLYAELIENRSFEHRDSMYSWSEVARGGAEGKLSVEDEAPLNASNRHFLRIHVDKDGENGFGVANTGFDGIAVEQGERFTFSVYARSRTGKKSTLRVMLEDGKGDVVASKRIKGIGPDWKKHNLKFKSSATVAAARLVLMAGEQGDVDVDMVSLFPAKTFRGHDNGLRPDLAQAFADIQPGFLRFPGGCIAEGRDFANMYRWKDTVGDVSERKQNYNLWGNRESPEYHQTYGLGFFEYFQFAEDIGAEPVPVVNCGMCCQARRGPLVPLDELEPYIQDALDLIEFANGPTSSKWGALRKSMGHPKPFNLRYVAVGNEQWQQEYFDRYDIFHRAIKEKHPEIEIVSTSGPHAEDPHYQFAWDKFRSGTPADVVDEHYYVPPRWLLENVDRYASYDPTEPKVFVGEFAAHDAGRRNNLRSALAEAAYMTGLLKYPDVVIMASYAPLLAKFGHAQWRPDLIWFNNTDVVLTPNYHVQALFGQNRPDVVLPTRVDAPIDQPTAFGKIGVGTWNTQAEYKDVKVVSADGRTLFESDFSSGFEEWQTARGEWSVVDGALRQSEIAENVLAVVGDPAWTDYTLSLKARKIDGREGFLVLFETPDVDSPIWWNIGGWNNTEHGLQGEGLPEQRVRGSVEMGRWYDIKIESRAGGVKAYLDGELVQEGERKPVATLFAVAGRSGKELILKVVNTAPEPQETTIKLEGVTRLAKTAKAVVLSGDPDDQNSLDEPNNLVPVTMDIEIPGSELQRVFPPNSLTMIRMTVQE